MKYSLYSNFLNLNLIALTLDLNLLFLFIILFIFDCVGSSLHGLFSSCGKWRLLSSCGREFFIVVASLVAEQGLQGAQASVVVVHGLSSFGSRALEHRLRNCSIIGLVVPQHVGSSWIEDQTCPSTLTDRFFTTEPPGKSNLFLISNQYIFIVFFFDCINHLAFYLMPFLFNKNI